MKNNIFVDVIAEDILNCFAYNYKKDINTEILFNEYITLLNKNSEETETNLIILYKKNILKKIEEIKNNFWWKGEKENINNFLLSTKTKKGE